MEQVYFIDAPCTIHDQGFCINFEDNQWVVFHQDCGRRIYKKKTTSESEACEYFLRWTLKREK